MMILWRKGLALIGIAALVGVASCGSDGSGGAAGQRQGGGRRGGRAAAAVPVKVEAVTRQDISDYSLTNTTLEAEKWVDVRSRTSGQVVEIAREEGDRVKRGSVLARLDAESARLRVAQMEVAYEEALRTYEREEAMYNRKLVSKERYENAKTDLDQKRAQHEEAKLNLSYTTIASPIDGIVTKRFVEIGNMATNNQVLFSVADFDPLLARIRIPEKGIGRIAVGQGAKITVESAPGKDFRGQVKMISPVVDPESGTIKVTIEIPGAGGGFLRPGMFASVYIITETHRNALVISKKAQVLEGEGDQVFVYEKDPETGMGRAVRKKIKTGFGDSERLEVVSGLSEGETVITVGQDGLRPGTAVRLVGEGAQAVASAEERGKRGEAAGVKGTAGGRTAGSGGSSGDAGELARMKARLFDRFPAVKEAFDKRVKQDPKLGTDVEKFRAFVGEMREKGIVPARGGRGGGRGR